MAERTLRARLVAETSQFGARIAAAEAQLGRMGRAPVAAARGMRVLQTGMQSLAGQAVGLTGPLGLLAQGLGSFALGGPLMLAVTAGLGAGALAARLFQKDIEELGRASHGIALDKAIANIHAAALGLSKTSLGQLNQDLERTKRAIQELTRTAVPAVGGGFILTLENEQQLNQLLADRLTFEKAISEERVKQMILAKELRFELVAAVQAMTAGLPSPRLQLLNQLGGGALRGVSPQMAGIDLPERALRLQRIANEALGGVELNRVSLDLRRKEHAAINANIISINRHADAVRLASVSTEQVAAALIIGVGGMLQGLAAGGAGGFFGGLLSLAGGIVGAGVKGLFVANPLLGAGLTVAGGIISTVAAQGRRDPIPVHDRAVRSELHDLRNEIREVLISVSFTGPERALSDIRYGLDRQTRRDAVPRLP